MINARRVTPELIQRMCLGDLLAHTKSNHMRLAQRGSPYDT
jgi:hypothetical protein